jgi:hypothetical protein
MADKSGNYHLNIDTSGIPAGEYKIEAAGESKTVQLGQTSQPSSGKLSEPEPERIITQPEQAISVTPEVIRWYAGQAGLDPQSQLKEAEDQLNRRLKGGYWKIISRGQPLTEQAGSCESQYCLVRGIGACTTCRDKDILTNKNLTTSQAAPAVPAPKDSQTQPEEDQGAWARLNNWLSQLL